MEERTYSGSKVKNHFTAYLLGQIRGRRRDYLKKKIQTCSMEQLVDEYAQQEFGMAVEESLEMERRERLLVKEAKGEYPRWDEMTDQRLQEALMMLREEERKLIYQHVFEERTFEEMSLVNGLPLYKAKGIYYYAIRKIRKWMGGDQS